MTDASPQVIVYSPDLLLRQQLVERLPADGLPVRGAATRARFDAALVIERDGGASGSPP